MAFVMPHIVPVKRAMPGLSMEDRKRLATTLAEAHSLADAARRYGMKQDRMVQIAKREGFASLLTRLRHPLTTAMADPVRREELMELIRVGVTTMQIAARFHTTKSAVWAYLYRTGLDEFYLKATKQRGRRRCLASVPGRNPQIVEGMCVAAMLAGRGLTVEAVPVWQNGSQVSYFHLKADGAPVKIVRPTIGDRAYYRANCTIGDTWYVVITPRRHMMAFAPPHSGETRYIPVVNPAKVMEGRNPPRFFWKPSEWPKPRDLGIRPIRRKRAEAA